MSIKYLQFCSDNLLTPTEADDKVPSFFSIIVATEFHMCFRKKVCLFP